jgi:phosphoglycolate phosphatase
MTANQHRPPSRPAVVAFDFDGTLADSFPVFLWALERAAARHGFRALEPERIAEFRALGGRALMAHLGIPLWKAARIGVTMRRLMAERAAEVRLFDGITEALEALAAARLQVAVVTSNAAATVRAVLGGAGVSNIHHFECGASLFGKSTRLTRVARRCGVPAERVVYVGDEVRDAEAAREAGMSFMGVAWGYTAPELLAPHADGPVFTTPGEMLASLLGDTAAP